MANFCDQCGVQLTANPIVHKEGCSHYVPLPAVKPKTQRERLMDIITAKYGSNWQQDITIKVRLSNLSWFVFLVEEGMIRRGEVMKAENKGRLDAAAMASLGSWHLDLMQLVDQVEKLLKK